MKKTTWTKTMTQRVSTPCAFNSIRGICMIFAFGLVAFGPHTASAQAESIAVTNFSFETVGTHTGGTWWELPDPGSWTRGKTNSYQISDISAGPAAFPSGIAPGGTKVLNLSQCNPLTQGLGYTVSAGDTIAISFCQGNAANQADPPGDATVSILVDGVVDASETVDNTATDGNFVAYQSVFTASSGGNLSIRFSGQTGCWLDLGDVSKVPSDQTPVGNFSFETEGTASGGAWYHLPDTGSWDKGGSNPYQILDISGGPSHFTSGIAPEGNNVLNLPTSSPLTHDLGTAVSSGQEVTIDFHLGDSESQTPGSVTVAILVDGSVDASELVTNTAADGGFAAFQSVLTASGSGNLSIRITNSGGNNWLDNVNVTLSAGTVMIIR